MSGSTVTIKDKTYSKTKCYHCGDPCDSNVITSDSKDFCCTGCKTVYEILSSNELQDYYCLEQSPGITQSRTRDSFAYDFLDNADIKTKLLDFASDNYERVTLHIPDVHCSSCIWLLENLERLNGGVLDSKIDFVKKRLTVHYAPKEISLRTLAELLDKIGYPPSIKLDEESDGQQSSQKSRSNALIVKLGVAGFCFGNVMLLSFPDYLGLSGIEETYSVFFRYLNMFLAIPVVLYSGSEYLVSAAKSIRQKFTNIDVPIALGIIVLFIRSSYEVISGVGPGYFDSLVGLIFFLLIGKWFQAKTYETLSFERNYKSYFPLAIQRFFNGKYEATQVNDLKKGDQILVRNNEVIPGDAILIDESASIDYSFVTGESEAISKRKGDYIYAGGRQIGKGIKLIIQKEISQSYLTQLWNDKAFGKDKKHVKLVDQISKYFTLAIVALAIGGALFWQSTDPSKTWTVFTAVLIVACPCALALSTPFTVGSVTRVFGRNKLYLKNSEIVERMSSVSTLVFDKTGTLTTPNDKKLDFHGTLHKDQQAMLALVTSQSTHPLSRIIWENFQDQDLKHLSLDHFEEVLGKGVKAIVNGVQVRLGSKDFLGQESDREAKSSSVHVEIGGDYLGYFLLKNRYREGISNLIRGVQGRFGLAILSGDHEGERNNLEELFPKGTSMFFRQSPDDKLEVIAKIQRGGNKVLMIGDGLNDAGALQQSEVGIAVTENTSHFSPASDAIIEAQALKNLDKFLNLSKRAKSIIVASFVLSLLYNVLGVSFALVGLLTPLFAAILMPLSSISVVIFTTLMVNWQAKNLKLN